LIIGRFGYIISSMLFLCLDYSDKNRPLIRDPARTEVVINLMACLQPIHYLGTLDGDAVPTYGAFVSNYSDAVVQPPELFIILML
jgi:hypothetical protein